MKHNLFIQKKSSARRALRNLTIHRAPCILMLLYTRNSNVTYINENPTEVNCRALVNIRKRKNFTQTAITDERQQRNQQRLSEEDFSSQHKRRCIEVSCMLTNVNKRQKLNLIFFLLLPMHIYI